MDNSNRQNRFRHKTRLSALGWATSLAAEMAQKQVISAREMMRIRGVYAYIINSIGNVAAVIGFHTLTVSVFEDQDDETPIKGFLRVDRWVYPMLRSFSPIFCWGPDKIILPDPFSSVGRPIYFVVRLPLLMTHHQKSTLWNLLDTCAHLRGQLSSPSLQEQLNRDKKFIHAMVTPFDNLILNQRAFLPSAEAAGLLEELGEPRLAFRRQALEFDDTATSVVVPPDLSRPSSETEFMNLPKAESGASSTRMQQPRRQSPLPKFSHKEFYYNDACLRQPEEELISNPGGLSLKSLPQHRGNVMRLYLLGPRDKQHIQIDTSPEWISIPQLLYSALQQAFASQVTGRARKEQLGCPPSFLPPRLITQPEFGQARHINAFGPFPPTPLVTRTINRFNLYHQHKEQLSPHIECRALAMQELESAAELFDHLIDTCQLELVSFEASDEVDPSLLLLAMTPVDAIVRFRRQARKFAVVNVISYTMQQEIAYTRHKPYMKRLLEDCEHNNPKKRPQNPYIDPKYTYARLPPVYDLHK